MTFDEWMLTVAPKHKPTDDGVTLRILRACWEAAAAAERERIRALVQAVRDANRDAEDGGETFRLLKPGQERAWMALLAGLDGPNA